MLRNRLSWISPFSQVVEDLANSGRRRNVLLFFGATLGIFRIEPAFGLWTETLNQLRSRTLRAAKVAKFNEQSLGEEDWPSLAAKI
jgi:hypothetical protein